MVLSKAIALVTGGGGGLGSRICLRLADLGADIAIGYHRGVDRAEQVRRAVQDRGRRALSVPLDLSDPSSIEAAVAQVVAELGALDLLINNAGMAMGGRAVAPGDLARFTPEIWDEMMAVNVRGPFLTTRAAAPHLRASAFGRVVNIGSTLGAGDWLMDLPFAPSKAAVVPLTRFLAASLAPEVAVNCVCPGLMVETGMGSAAPKERVAQWRARAALGVTTSPDDVAAQVVAFCQAASITGQCVVIDGGVHFR